LAATNFIAILVSHDVVFGDKPGVFVSCMAVTILASALIFVANRRACWLVAAFVILAVTIPTAWPTLFPTGQNMGDKMMSPPDAILAVTYGSLLWLFISFVGFGLGWAQIRLARRHQIES
jgi:hypothetical protein